MKILWLTNIMLPSIAVDMLRPITNAGGWLTGLSNDLIKQEAINLSICFPISNETKIVRGYAGKLEYFGFPQKKNHINKYDKQLEKYFEYIISELKPEIVHIFGTEYPHTLAMVNVCRKLKIKFVISIQGLVSLYAHHYMAFVPNLIQYKYTFRDFIKHDNLNQQQKKFVNRGEFEINAIQKAINVIGRTTWDKTCIKQINSKVRYYFCNETLRDEFYKNKWSLDSCVRYSIFISQGSYPIKGLHLMLEALQIITRRNPCTHLFIAGQDIIKLGTLKERLKKTSYAKYIDKLINKYELKNNITFTGSLNEKQMCERYLKSHIFVCPSSIENSPNSLGEAMILGVPCVASYVGGIPDMIKHNEEGFTYQADAPYMLANYICEIFRNDDLALKFSKNAREHALQTHDRDKNTNRIIEIYNRILEAYD